MKSNIVIAFVGGAVIGAGTAILIMKKKYEAIADEEIESVKETMKKHKDGLTPNLYVVDDPLNKEENISKMKREKSKYKKFVRPYQGEEESTEENQEEEEDYPENHNPGRDPYVISCEQFSEEMNNFDKLTIYYYEEDNTLADESEEVIPDIEKTIGQEALDCFGEDSEDPEIVYVRNEKMEIDYEVILVHSSYTQDILGYEPEDKHKRRHEDNEDQ